MKTLFYFLVDLPGTDMSLTWMGGGLKPSSNAGKVWLTSPTGEPMMEVDRKCVHPSTPKEVALRIQEDKRWSRRDFN